MAKRRLDRFRILFDLGQDERGQAMIEYALLLAVIVVPVGLVLDGIRDALASYYGMISIVVGLPIP